MSSEEFRMISVIIPCYNAEEFVAEAIESALGQSYDPKEVIVVDDGSTDGSFDEIRPFGKRVRWKQTQTRGASAARNEGIELANGELIKFLDADDILADGVLQRQVAELREDCTSNQIPFGDILKLEAGTVTKEGYASFEPGEEMSLMRLLKRNIQTSAPLHRRAFLEQVGGFDEDLLYQDEYDLHIRLHAAGVRLRYFEGVCCQCRAHNSEERLSKRNFVAERPDQVRQWIKKRMNVTADIFEDGLPEEVRIHFAQSLWASGRRALRVGHPEAAQRFFDDARGVHSEKCVNGSFLYRAGVRLLGPRYCESAKGFLETN